MGAVGGHNQKSGTIGPKSCHPNSPLSTSHGAERGVGGVGGDRFSAQWSQSLLGLKPTMGAVIGQTQNFSFTGSIGLKSCYPQPGRSKGLGATVGGHFLVR